MVNSFALSLDITVTDIIIMIIRYYLMFNILQEIIKILQKISNRF